MRSILHDGIVGAEHFNTLPNVGWVLTNHLLSMYACALPIDPHTRWHARLPKCTTTMSYNSLKCEQLYRLRAFACCGRTLKDVISIQTRILRHCINNYNQVNVRWNTTDIVALFYKGNSTRTSVALSSLRTKFPALPMIELKQGECFPR